MTPEQVTQVRPSDAKEKVGSQVWQMLAWEHSRQFRLEHEKQVLLVVLREKF